MIPKLTTHVLDITHGHPASGVKIELFHEGARIAETTTNRDGRCPEPLLEGDGMFDGACELRFHVGDYFQGHGVESPFLDVVPVRFQLRSLESFHVPLVCSPWSYSTYRGS